MRSLTRNFVGIAAVVAITTSLVGCSTGSGDTANVADPAALNIVATTTQITDFTANVIEGTDAEITSLLQPNVSAHSFEANAAHLEHIRGADVVIMNGMELEPWLEDSLDAAGFDGLLIDASAGMSEDRLIASNDDDDDHDHSDHNPHIWTAPLMAADMTTEIAEQLAALDETQGEAYLANAATYIDKLAMLDEWVGANVGTIDEAERLIVSEHDALTYYNHDYGITFVGSVMPSWDDNAEPSAAEIDALVAAIAQSGVTAIFTETQLNPGTAEAIASEAGITVYAGDEALFTDALGPEGSAGETYIGSTIHNTTQLIGSWGGAVTEAPAELQGASLF